MATSQKIILFFLLIFPLLLPAQTPVNVGGYSFAPFVEETAGSYTGLTIRLMDEMNAFQDTYRFRFVPTSPKRRYVDFQRGRFDVIFFESRQWGWEDYPVDASRVYLEGGERFIAKAVPGRGQDYFDDFTGKSLLGFLGYHYGFAGFNADEEFLKEQFNMTVYSGHERNIQMILGGRADIAVVTKSYINKFLLANPRFRSQLLLSNRLDQIYRHTILVRRDSRPSVGEINQLLDDMEEAGVLARLWREFGIEEE